MKVTLDLTQLLKDRKISKAEFDKLKALSAESTYSLLYNLLIGFGIIAVSVASLALSPSALTAIVLGLIITISGLFILKSPWQQWALISHISIVIGTLMISGGLIMFTKGSMLSYGFVSLLLFATGIGTQNHVLIALAVFSLSQLLTQEKPSYYLRMPNAAIAAAFYSLMTIWAYAASLHRKIPYQNLALTAAKSALILANIAFWISTWDKYFNKLKVLGFSISPLFMAFTWAAFLILIAAWAIKKNDRWLLIVAALFGALHAYTQWFIRLSVTPATVLIAGLFTIGIALAIRHINRKQSINK